MPSHSKKHPFEIKMVKFFTLWAARLCSLYSGVTLSYAKFNSVDMYIYFKTHCWLTATRTLK